MVKVASAEVRTSLAALRAFLSVTGRSPRACRPPWDGTGGRARRDVRRTRAGIQPWHAAGTDVLPVWCQPEHASIGPGLTPAGGPCLHCLDLTRAAADPDWPYLRAQLVRPRVTGPEPTDGLPAVRLLAAGLTTALVLDHLAGLVTTPEWSFEVATPGPTLERHRWPSHPGCPGCARTASAPPDDTTPEGGSAAASGWGDTMAV